jgi:hypothetical protein
MAIMQDPVMNSILQQAQGDPAALQDHMKNPSIKSKVRLSATSISSMLTHNLDPKTHRGWRNPCWSINWRFPSLDKVAFCPVRSIKSCKVWPGQNVELHNVL